MQIYIHIPFCELKCKYCRFASIWNIQNLHIDKYVSFLCKEINELKVPVPSLSKYNKGTGTYLNKKKKIRTIYFGWGTPSVLKEKHFKKIFESLKSRFIFEQNIEITIESTPNNITSKNLEIWNNLWINRFSIWIQTLNKKTLEEINRWNKGDVEKALEVLKTLEQNSLPTVVWNKKKIDLNISLDFIIWLPYVKKWEILENIKYVLEKYSFIKHISVYMLEEYYNPDKVIETKFDNITYPKDWDKLWIKDEDYLWEYSSIKKFLQEKWFINYEISNFSKLWSLCKHNKWYWNHKEVLAFWMGAYWIKRGTGTHLNGYQYLRYANADNFKDYYAWKRIFEEELLENDIFLEKVMFGLRTSWLEKDIYKKLNQEKINYFIKNWYLEKKSDKIILSDKWVLVLDYILKEIL